MTSGPFVLKPDSTVTTCIGIIGALDTTTLKTASDVAQIIYDNGFRLADPPSSPSFVFTASPGDAKAYLSWNKAVETTPDPYWGLLPDVKSWNTYFPGSWSKLSSASQLLVDSFEVDDKLSSNLHQDRPGALFSQPMAVILLMLSIITNPCMSLTTFRDTWFTGQIAWPTWRIPQKETRWEPSITAPAGPLVIFMTRSTVTR